MATPEAPLPHTLPYHIMDGIRRRIILGEFAPGAPIRELEIEAIFGSSRGPIREALLMLERRGLVVHMPRRGFRVRSHDARSIGDLYRLRALLERALVLELARQDVAPLVAALTAALERMRQHHAARDINAYFDENMAYHQAMIDAVDNEFLRRALDSVNEISLPIRYLLLSRRFSEGKSLRFHEEQTRLIAGREFAHAADAAERKVLSNVDHVVKAYAEAMARQTSQPPPPRGRAAA